MGLKLDDRRMSGPGPKIPPPEYAGEWVAWNEDRSVVIAHGTDVAAVRAAANSAGYQLPLLEKVPRPDP